MDGQIDRQIAKHQPSRVLSQLWDYLSWELQIDLFSELAR
jgi:hypothetical protein